MVYVRFRCLIENYTRVGCFFVWTNCVDGFFSPDIDECVVGSARCHETATCVNIPGSFSCVCGPGYTGDGIVCDGTQDLYFSF